MGFSDVDWFTFVRYVLLQGSIVGVSVFKFLSERWGFRRGRGQLCVHWGVWGCECVCVFVCVCVCVCVYEREREREGERESVSVRVRSNCGIN